MDFDMAGRVCLITGASDGIGRAAALALGRMGADLILSARSRDKMAEVAAAIRAARPAARVEVRPADLSALAEVRRLAAEVRAAWPRLHVLVNNVGAIFARREETVDGIERTFALDHLGYFLLTRELLDVLQRSAPARIVNVSSGAESGGRIHFDDPGLRRGYSSFAAYSQAKLANVMFTYALSRRLAGSGVTANVMHPGGVATGFAQNNERSLFKWLVRLVHPLLLTAEQGADTVVWLAASPEVEGVSGRYFHKRRELASSRRSHDLEAQQRLWALSEELCGVGSGWHVPVPPRPAEPVEPPPTAR